VAVALHGSAPPAHGRRPWKRGGSPAWDGGASRRRRASSEAAGAARRWSRRRRLRTAAVRTRAVRMAVRGERRAAVGVAARGSRRANGRREAVGRAADAARLGAYSSSRACVRTAPPMAANHGLARRDTAIDRRAPRVSRISNLNKSPGMKIARRK
jgi:hypothetical protein